MNCIFIYGDLDSNTTILIYISTSFMNKIKKAIYLMMKK